MHVSVGVHIGHTAVANFYIGPAKKSMQFVMRRKMFINDKVLNDKPNEMGINNCNCRNKDNCPLPNSCQTKCIIYEANIDCDIGGYKQKCYLGSCETTFKDRFGNHKKSFNHLKHKNDTELSKEFWEIKKHNGTPKIAWKIIRICPSYNPNSKRCL